VAVSVFLYSAYELHNLFLKRKQRAAFFLPARYTPTNKSAPRREREYAMPNYAKMYRKLFNSQTDAINILQKAQQETEEMYADAPEPEVRLSEVKQPSDEDGVDKE
jgi:hypothetical protein